MKILITGNKGFIGTHLEKALSENKDFDVYGCDIKRRLTEDIRNEMAMKALFGKVKPDVVIHLAALPGVRESEKRPLDYIDTNIWGTYNLLKMSEKYGVKNFLFASSSSVCVSEKCPIKETMPTDYQLSLYSITKRTGESLCYMFKNVPTVVFRPYTVYGENGREKMVVRKLITAAKNGEVFEKYGDGKQIRGYTNVHDLVDGIIKLIDYKPKDNFEIFNLGGIEKIRLNDLIKMVKKVYPKLKVEQVERHPADVNASWADITKAKKVLGWEPKRNFKEEIIKLCNL
jgi:UDP-glucuronate 4-epimerase